MADKPCRACEGSGQKIDDITDEDDSYTQTSFEVCPICKGSGIQPQPKRKYVHTASIPASAWGYRSALPYVGPCRVCAPKMPGKAWALMTTSGRDAVHMCGGTNRVSSKVLSYHASEDAVKSALRAYVKARGPHRIYYMKVKGNSPLSAKPISNEKQATGRPASGANRRTT